MATVKTFKNKNFTKRNYECTNIVFCQSTVAPDANWVKCKTSEISEMRCGQIELRTVNGVDVRYFGYL